MVILTGKILNVKYLLIFISLVVVTILCLNLFSDFMYRVDKPVSKIQNVPAAPMQVSISQGETKNITYWNHEITLSYVSDIPQQTIEIVINGKKETVVIDRSMACIGGHCIYNKTEGDVVYLIQPVTWKLDGDKRIMTFETWNTSHLYIEIYNYKINGGYKNEQ